MLRTRNAIIAREHAASKGHFYGTSVFDGWYYTGTREALKHFGVADILDPETGFRT